VYKTKATSLNNDFTSSFGVRVPVTIDEWPEYLELVLYNATAKRIIAEIEIPLPNR